MKIVRPLIAVFAISLGGMMGSDATAQAILDENFRIEERDFATPEATFQHFIGSMKVNDLGAALQAFAINDYADGYDFKAMSDGSALSPRCT